MLQHSLVYVPPVSCKWKICFWLTGILYFDVCFIDVSDNLTTVVSFGQMVILCLYVCFEDVLDNLTTIGESLLRIV